jgi:two-component sensor histidine kinase
MLLVPNALHVIEYMWLVIFALYAFFVFGKKTGYFLLGLSLVFFTVYLFYFLDDNIKNIEGNISRFQMLATLMNLVLGGFMTGVLVTEFKATKAHADNKYKEVNLDLQVKNNLIKAQDEEKTIMLREIHHRVKNNLQVVSSLIRLQSFETEDAGAKKMFDATVNRVVAMALIHEKMYQKDNLSKINLADYLSTLAHDILSSTGNSKKFLFDIKSELEIIGNRTVVPLALIFNELISNSLKHGFKDMTDGKIDVDIVNVENNDFIIKYADNGVWKDNLESSSFGLELINTFVEQLDGESVRESNENGTTYTVQLKNIE